MRAETGRVKVSQSGGPAARQRHRCRAPDTAVMPPLTWKGSIVPLRAQPGTGPVPARTRPGPAAGAGLTPAGAGS